jgi:hypothetical protein
LPEIDRQQAQGKEVAFRGDAAFARPEVYEAHEARQVRYAIRLPANANLECRITELLKRPAGMFPLEAVRGQSHALLGQARSHAAGLRACNTPLSVGHFVCITQLVDRASGSLCARLRRQFRG